MRLSRRLPDLLGQLFHGNNKQFEDYWKGRSLSFVTSAMHNSGFDVVSRMPMSVLMAAPTDTRRRELNERVWEKMMTPVRHSEWVGFLAGMLYIRLSCFLSPY